MLSNTTHGYVKTNPSPKKPRLYFACCHWNVNNLIVHNKLKLCFLKAYNSVHNHDFICIIETYVDYSVKSDDVDLRINGYKLTQIDQPLNTILQRIINFENDNYLVLTRVFTLCSYGR